MNKTNQKKINDYNIIDWIKLIGIVLIVIGIGFFAVNQTLGYYYKAQLLYSPCKICLDLNPEVEDCFIQKEFKINLSSIKIENNFT